jgi:predicted SnoaL-like aldol condensation-catalyzing enzyme
MRRPLILLTATLSFATALAHADECRLKPKEVVTKFMTQFYLEKRVREAFETWVEPGYIQHNPLAATGRDAAIAFLEPFFKSHPDAVYSIKRIIEDGNLIAVQYHTKFTTEERDIANMHGIKRTNLRLACAQPASEATTPPGMF